MGISGVVVGRVVAVRPHPNADRIRLADVDLGDGVPVQIVFGGPPVVVVGSLVPVAPPGARVPKGKMRRSRYRGELSHGMLCSLDELGWTRCAPDVVALLRDVAPGASLDDRSDWTSLVASPELRPEWMAVAQEPAVTPVLLRAEAMPGAPRTRAGAAV